MERKVKRYTETVLVRLDKKTKLKLAETSYHLEMNEAVYGRRAIELCLEKNLIDGKGRA